MRGKKRTPEPPKPEKVPEKLARPFATAIADRVAKEAAARKAMEEAAAARTAAEQAGAADAAARKAARATAASDGAARKGAGSTPVLGATKTNAKRSATPLGHHGYDDRVAFQQAFADVRPLARHTGTAAKTPRAPSPALARAAEADVAARARLDALVADAVRFVFHRDLDGAVAGRRIELAERTLDNLYEAAPKARLDLHGKNRDEARVALLRFVREQQANTPRDVLVIHGKGLHGDGPVLADVVETALTTTSAAGRVLAFVTAPERLGGLGATLVRLSARG